MKRIILFVATFIILQGCMNPNINSLESSVVDANGEPVANVVYDTLYITDTVYIQPEADPLDLMICKRIYALSDSLDYFTAMYDNAILNDNSNEKTYYYKESSRIKTKILELSATIYKRYSIE